MALFDSVRALFRPSILNNSESYLRNQRFDTETKEIREGCYIIEGTRTEMGVTERKLLMIVTGQEDELTKDHIVHLVKTGKSRNADAVEIVCDTDATTAAKQAISKTPVAVVNKRDLTSSGQNNQPRKTEPATPKANKERSMVTRRRALSGIGAITTLGAAGYIIRDPHMDFPFVADTYKEAEPLDPADHELIPDSTWGQIERFGTKVTRHNQEIAQENGNPDYALHEDSKIGTEDGPDYNQDGVVTTQEGNRVDVLEIDGRIATVRVTGHPHPPDSAGRDWDAADEIVTEVYTVKGIEGKLEEESWEVLEYIDING